MNLVAALLHRHAVITKPSQTVLQMSELMEVRGDQRLAADSVVDIFDHRLRDRHPFAGGRASAQLIDNDQAARSGFLRHNLNVSHLHHKGALSANQIVRRANPRKYAVDQRDFRLGRRHETADLRQDRNEGDLPHVRALPCHVRPRNQQNAGLILAKRCAVGDKCRIFHHGLHHRMPTLLHDEVVAVGQLRLHKAIV
ncbi:hypothetical protein D3C74_311880 [compost metagenome]